MYMESECIMEDAMITQQELNALVQLCNRIPLSQSEALWLQALLNQLQDEIVKSRTEATAQGGQDSNE